MNIKFSLLTAVLLSSFVAKADISSQQLNRFCSERKGEHDVQKLLFDEDNRISFQNQGGLFNGGVCWWHSRFLRKAAYLAVFSPTKPVPSEKEIKKIIDDLRRGRGIVEIPGYKNLTEFTSENSDLVLKELEAWQRIDGFINQGWLLGIRGKTKVAPEKFKSMMDELYADVSSGEVVFQILQIKGIDAHAWLVIDMKKTYSGYELKVVDSNFPLETKTYFYEEGMTNFNNYYYGDFVGYTYKSKEDSRLQKRVEKICN